MFIMSLMLEMRHCASHYGVDMTVVQKEREKSNKNQMLFVDSLFCVSNAYAHASQHGKYIYIILHFIENGTIQMLNSI